MTRGQWGRSHVCIDADLVCVVDLNCHVRHVDPPMRRVEESRHLLRRVSIQLLQGAANTYQSALFIYDLNPQVLTVKLNWPHFALFLANDSLLLMA